MGGFFSGPIRWLLGRLGKPATVPPGPAPVRHRFVLPVVRRAEF